MRARLRPKVKNIPSPANSAVGSGTATYFLVQSQTLAAGRGGTYTGMVHGEKALTIGLVPESVSTATLMGMATIALLRCR